jgi:hypothetical protein
MLHYGFDSHQSFAVCGCRPERVQAFPNECNMATGHLCKYLLMVCICTDTHVCPCRLSRTIRQILSIYSEVVTAHIYVVKRSIATICQFTRCLCIFDSVKCIVLTECALI